MPHQSIQRVRTAALERGGSVAHRNKALGNAIAHALTARQPMDAIMEAAAIRDVYRIVDLATIGGFTATCTSADFRDAANLLSYYNTNGPTWGLHEEAVCIRVSAMLRLMAGEYDKTVALNAQQAERQTHGR